MQRGERRRARSVAAYAEWRVASVAVAHAYGRWAGARAGDRRHAFADFNVALNREEHAASRFADLVPPAPIPANPRPRTVMSSVPIHSHRVPLSHTQRLPRRRDHHSVLFVSTVAALGGLLFGYDTGVISGALLFVKKSFHLGSTGQGVVVSAVLVGAVLGAALAMALGDRTRRRTLIFASALVFILGSLIATIATSDGILVTGRVILGIAIGLSSSVVPVYIAEISPEERRGGYVALFQLAITVGIFLAYLVNLAFAGIEGWRWMFLCGIVPALALWGGMLFLPGSPRWLVLKGRKAEAAEALKALGEPDPQAKIAEIEASIALPPGSWRELLVPFARRALLVGIGLGVFQQFIGINTVIYYAPTILQFSGFHSATVAILATLGVGAVNVGMTLVALRLIDRLGRRRLLIRGLVPMAAALLAIGFAFDFSSSAVRWIAIASLAVYVGAFAVSWGWGFWLLNAELYPLEVRGRGTGLVVMIQWAANLAVSLTFLLLIHAIGKPATFSLYAGLCLLALLFTVAWVPETKGRSLEQIEAYWRRAAAPSVAPVPQHGPARP
jgi:MFS transporter, SP family, galactose:H+ symporter